MKPCQIWFSNVGICKCLGPLGIIILQKGEKDQPSLKQPKPTYEPQSLKYSQLQLRSGSYLKKTRNAA